MVIQLQKLIKDLQRDGNYLQALKRAKTSYSVDQAQLKMLTPSSVLLFIQKLHSKHMLDNEGKNEVSMHGEHIWCDRWHPNEYKHFSWLCIGYFFIKKAPISSFNQQDIEFLSSVFASKKRIFIQYHFLSLIKQSKSKREEWSKHETELLYELMNTEKHKGKWSQISYKIYQLSNKAHFRTSHKCRQMWFNHLDPNVRHHKWTLEEDLLLFQLVTKDGTKWAQISKAMQGVRTEHMVKNRFNSIIKQYSLKYQRYSHKKLAEIIKKALQKKLNNYEASEIFKEENKQESILLDEVKMEEQQGKEEIMFIGHQRQQSIVKLHANSVAINQQVPESKAEQQNNYGNDLYPTEGTNPQQFSSVSSQLMQSDKQRAALQKEESNKQKQNQAEDFNMKIDMEQEGEVAQLQWIVMCKVKQVELIDYLGIQYEFIPTIFSGTN